jgi:Sulfotransferase family
MTSFDVWTGRLERRWGYAQRWFSLRKKDLAWMFLRHRFKRDVPRLLNDHQWVFLVGCNNSGTTLIHDVLASTGRFSFMPHEGQRYTNVLRRAEKKGHERVWSEYLEELRLDERDGTENVPRLLFDWIWEMTSPIKTGILEKTTANSVRMRWLQRAFPGAAFIGVVRNGYGVVEGIRRKGHKSVDRGARHWRRVNEIMLEDAARLERFLLISYEEFVGSPERAALRLSEFLGMDRRDLEFAFRKINGTPGAAIQDMNALSLQRLDAGEFRAISREAGEMLVTLKYEDGPTNRAIDCSTTERHSQNIPLTIGPDDH